MNADKKPASRVSLPDLVTTYDDLADFNRHCASASSLIEVIGRRGLIPKSDRIYYGALLEELRAALSQNVLERVSEAELAVASSASHKRLRLEKRMFKE